MNARRPHDRDPSEERERIRVEVGRRIRERRKAAGLTQERIAELARIHRTYVHRIERGDADVALRNLLSLSAALDIDVGDLLRGL